MLWLQSVACFVVWIGYGVWLARSRTAKALLPRFQRGLFLGPFVLVLGTGLFAAALYGVALNRGLINGLLQPWALLTVLVAGLVFVHAQSIGALALFASAIKSETPVVAKASVPKEDSP